MQSVLITGPLLEHGRRKLIVNVSSEAGSLQHSWRERTYGYCMSKAALNMQSTILDRALKSRGFDVLALHPGWMRTDMGGPRAQLDPLESAAGMYEVVQQASATTPRFLRMTAKSSLGRLSRRAPAPVWLRSVRRLERGGDTPPSGVAAKHPTRWRRVTHDGNRVHHTAPIFELAPAGFLVPPAAALPEPTLTRRRSCRWTRRTMKIREPLVEWLSCVRRVDKVAHLRARYGTRSA